MAIFLVEGEETSTILMVVFKQDNGQVPHSKE